ncbi:FAD-dependent monooxygenase [Xenorhabdus bovienii]|uniref:FAD-dependent monooxygenase n=1 Tax=Xenorhabdus bovienii TaxID=40576 RepID=A0AAJ1JCQ1_XENBV|nr:FAD-dependent monooxygenase [Xenorhabdus bovienii]MDE1480211.1 FAD-dependent monooxygenase [Xenorhabdus bovienii]MDE1491137.1 FAD-dependent monooxygenase [Xenorhabdus bovienii]MDE9511902.1 FAD-dependent monooxygenase [Xenorhabdus bovienii]MDE9523544.1 FAD-dependent monooxygenase [Xenorhabdus bovienii]
MAAITDCEGKVVIVGAGIGGVTLAAQLSLSGIECDIYEQRMRFSEDGFGLNIQPEAVSVLYRLGLAEKLDSCGIQTRAHRYVDHLGTLLFEEARGIEAGFDTPQMSISRSKLLNLIFSVAKTKATFNFGTKFSTDVLHKTEWAKNLIVGADGIHSIVRQNLFPDSMQLNSGNMMLWRGITPMPKFLDGRTMIIANSEEGVRLIAYPVSKSHDLRGESLINWVILVPTSLDKPFDTTINRFQATDFLLDLLKEWHFDWLNLQTLITTSKTLMRTAMVDRNPLDKWSHNQCVLIGDAAHPMFPIGANGATQSIIDAGALASTIYETPDFESAITKYEHIRIPAVSRIVMANREMNLRELASQALNQQERVQELVTTATHYKAETTKMYSD